MSYHWYSSCLRYWNRSIYHLDTIVHVKQDSPDAWIFVNILAVNVIIHTNKTAFQIDKYRYQAKRKDYCADMIQVTPL